MLDISLQDITLLMCTTAVLGTYSNVTHSDTLNVFHKIETYFNCNTAIHDPYSILDVT